VSEIKSDALKKRKQQFVFRVAWPGEDEEETKEEANGAQEAADKKSGILRSRSSRNKETKDSKAAVTKTNSGNGTKEEKDKDKDKEKEKEKSGYMSSLLGWAGFSSSEAIAFNSPVGDKDKITLFAADRYEDAEIWVKAIEDQIRVLSGPTAANASNQPAAAAVQVMKVPPPPDIRITEVENWLKSTAWKVYNVVDGARVFEYVGNENGRGKATSSVKSPPCLRMNIGMTGSVGDVFLTIMNLPPSCRNGTIKSLRVVDTIDNCTDIIQIVLEPSYVPPTWTGAHRCD
jgi:hypothetical protein